MNARPGDERPTSRPQISRDFLEAQRRRRYAEATAEILHEFGREGLSVTTVVRLARSSRSSFYETFGGIEDCLAHATEIAESELFAGLGTGGDGAWLAEVHRAVAGFYAVVAARPLMAELFLIHAAGSRIAERHDSFWSGGERFAPLLRQGRQEAAALGRGPLPGLAEEWLSRSIVSLAARRVRGPELAGLPAEAWPATLLAGTFYLGREASEEALSGAVAA